MKRGESSPSRSSNSFEGIIVSKIISGGQTGVDRAALDVALDLEIPCGGWCPRGRRAEDGIIPERYPLIETPTAAYPQRTEWNVRDSDGTLVLTVGRADGGTALTISLTRRLNKSCKVVNLKKKPDIQSVRDWIQVNQLQVLNVAGPRDNAKGEIYCQASQFLRQLFAPSDANMKSKEKKP